MSALTEQPVRRRPLLGPIAIGALVGAIAGTVVPTLTIDRVPEMAFWTVLYIPVLAILAAIMTAAGWCGFALGSVLAPRSVAGALVAGAVLATVFGLVVYGIADAAGALVIVWPASVLAALGGGIAGGLVPRVRLRRVRTR